MREEDGAEVPQVATEWRWFIFHRASVAGRGLVRPRPRGGKTPREIERSERRTARELVFELAEGEEKEAREGLETVVAEVDLPAGVRLDEQMRQGMPDDAKGLLIRRRSVDRPAPCRGGGPQPGERPRRSAAVSCCPGAAFLAGQGGQQGERVAAIKAGNPGSSDASG